MKMSLGQLSLKYIGLKIWSDFDLIFLKNLNLFRSIHLQNNTKTPCYLAKIPVDFRLKCLSLFSDIVLMPLSSLVSFTSTVVHPCSKACFFPYVFVVILFTYFISRWFDAFCYFSFATCETSSIPNWFVLAKGLVENLIHAIFRQPFVIQTCWNTIINLLNLEFLMFLYFHKREINFWSLMLLFFPLLHSRYFVIWVRKICMNKPLPLP